MVDLPTTEIIEPNLIFCGLKAEKKEKSQKIKEFSDNYLQNKNTSDIIVTQLKQRK